MNNHIFRKTLLGLSNILIIIGVAYVLIGFWPVISSEAKYQWYANTQFKQLELLDYQKEIDHLDGLQEAPKNTTFTVMIPKININAPIVKDTSVTNESEYNAALQHGVAHANVSDTPSNNAGNTYLFAHSTPNPLDIEKYSATFTLLAKLDTDDIVVIFHDDIRYDYKVIENIVVSSFNTEPLTKSYNNPTLTLQTCDPPGIPINRRIVTAELVNTLELDESESTDSTKDTENDS